MRGGRARWISPRRHCDANGMPRETRRICPMELLANYPIAVAPAMGHNFFFAYSVVIGMKVPWRVALGAVAVAGVIFILTAGIGLRERLITAMPDSIKHAIAAGIGLLIAAIG